jgi:hypothetical protein
MALLLNTPIGKTIAPTSYHMIVPARWKSIMNIANID